MQWNSDRYWHWLRTESGNFLAGISGKYLFFSQSIDVLKFIAESECQGYGFFLAKISVDATAGEHVLCLYWTDDSRKHELAQRHSGNGNIKYRYWKSNAQTRRGEYSDYYRNAK